MKSVYAVILLISLQAVCFAKGGVGIKAGLNLQQMNANGWSSANKSNVLAGIYAYKNGKKLGILVEAFYTNNQYVVSNTFKGLYTSYYNNLLDSAVNGSFKFSSIQIPVMATYKFNKTIWLQSGLQYTAGINAVDKNSFVKTATQIIKENDIALIGGVWINFSKRIQASARYSQGISNLNLLPSNNEAWRNQAIQLSLGYKLL